MQQLINHQLDLSIIILWIGLAFLTACTTLMFNHFLKPGMVFNWYAIFLESFEKISKKSKRLYEYYKYKYVFKYPKQTYILYAVLNMCVRIIFSILSYLAKPLGLCPYCNGTWIGIVVYIYFFSFSLPIILFLGINWFFIHIIYTKLK